MRTSKRDRMPKKKDAKLSYWVKSEEDDGFIPRVCYDEQKKLPHVFTHHCTLIAESCLKEATNVRE